MTLHDVSSVVDLLIAVAVVAAGIAAWRALKERAIVSSANEALDLAGKERELLKAELVRLREDVSNLREMVDLTDKRQYRTELAMQRKDRLHLMDRQEIEQLEEIIHIMLPALAKTAPDIKREVDRRLKALAEHRVRVHREQIDWEERKDALTVYLTPSSQDARDAVLAADDLGVLTAHKSDARTEPPET